MEDKRLNRLMMRQPSDDWIENRSTYLGGTDIAAIMNLHPYKTPRIVYLEKKGLINAPEINQAMIHGQNLELYVMQLYRLDTGRKVHKSKFYRDKQYSFLAVNPDYEIRGEPGLLECKTAGAWTGQEFGTEADAVPNQYLVQCMWQMAITGREWVDLAVLIGGQDYRCYTIGRDDGLIEKLRSAAIEFWNEYILSENPPPLTGDRPDCELVNSRYAESGGGAMYATENVEVLCQKLRQIKQHVNVIDKEAKRLENEIKSAMENFDELHSSVGKITWKANKNGVRSFRTAFKEEEIWQVMDQQQTAVLMEG